MPNGILLNPNKCVFDKKQIINYGDLLSAKAVLDQT